MTTLDLTLCIINVLAFVIYAIDKLCARQSWSRVPEWFLIMLALLFGGTGSFLSMRLFHHKTRKPMFYILVPLLMVIQTGLYVFYMSEIIFI